MNKSLRLLFLLLSILFLLSFSPIDCSSSNQIPSEITNLYDEREKEQIQKELEFAANEFRKDEQQWDQMDEDERRQIIECPVQGTIEELNRAGNRLLYEGLLIESRACFRQAVNQYLQPNGEDVSRGPNTHCLDTSLIVAF